MIKFADLQVNNQAAIDAVVDVMHSGKFINGVWNARFGAIWARECGVEECILTSSGTSALIATLKCTLRGRSNNYVIMPALSFAATAFAALEAGCQPIYVDVDEHGLIRWDQVEDVAHQYGYHKIHAVIPVHLYGQYTPTPSHIKEKFYIIEDACQAHGVVQSPTITPNHTHCYHN